MSVWIGALLLLGGALLCVFAAIGVLRLPDFFMRMHAATKAGVAGCGLILLGVAAMEDSSATWIKAAVAVLFLLLTTPVAGHLIGRAGYVSGSPLWRGTHEDALADVLPRGQFDVDDSEEVFPNGVLVKRVVLALAEGPCIDRAIAQAVALAQHHDAELHGVAIIDVPKLMNVGPVPIGAGWHAQKMREYRIAQARRAAAAVIQRFEDAARQCDRQWSTHLVEGRPREILGGFYTRGSLLLAAEGGWFDQGVLSLRVDVASRLEWPGRQPVQVVH